MKIQQLLLLEIVVSQSWVFFLLWLFSQLFGELIPWQRDGEGNSVLFSVMKKAAIEKEARPRQNTNQSAFQHPREKLARASRLRGGKVWNNSCFCSCYIRRESLVPPFRYIKKAEHMWERKTEFSPRGDMDQDYFASLLAHFAEKNVAKRGGSKCESSCEVNWINAWLFTLTCFLW